MLPNYRFIYVPAWFFLKHLLVWLLLGVQLTMTQVTCRGCGTGTTKDEGLLLQQRIPCEKCDSIDRRYPELEKCHNGQIGAVMRSRLTNAAVASQLLKLEWAQVTPNAMRNGSGGKFKSIDHAICILKSSLIQKPVTYCVTARNLFPCIRATDQPKVYRVQKNEIHQIF